MQINKTVRVTWQTVFYQAVSSANTQTMKLALLKGAKINNGECKRNTLNCAIRAMLNTNTKSFNLNFIKELIQRGAKMCVENENNTLTNIIKCVNNYIDINKNIEMNKNNAEKNILDLIKLIIGKGGKTCNSRCNLNTLDTAINTKNQKIVKIIIKMEPQPITNPNTLCRAINSDNIKIVKIIIKFINKIKPLFLHNSNTLNLAIRTKNLEIIDLICGCDTVIIPHCSELYKNTLSCSILTGNHQIVKKVIMKGGTPINTYNIKNLWDIKTIPLFDEYYYYMHDNNIYENYSINDIDYMINLIMCSGALISPKMKKYIFDKKLKTYIDDKFLICYDLITHVNSTETKELKKELIITMDELIGKSTSIKIKIEIDKALFCIPCACINIINEYQIKKSVVKFIDWST